MNNQKSDRKELERRLERAHSPTAYDDVTKERMQRLIRDLEEQLREPK